MSAIHKVAVQQVGREYDLQPSMIYLLSAISYCTYNHGYFSTTTTTQVRKILPVMQLATFYDRLKQLRQMGYIEVVGNHTPKGRTPTKYCLTGSGLMIIDACNSRVEATINTPLDMVAETPLIHTKRK